MINCVTVAFSRPAPPARARLFRRTTRKLTLTEDGERFLQAVSGGLESIQSAIAAMATQGGQPAGTLKVSMAPGFGVDYVLPLLPGFIERYPALRTDWHFDNRRVDLVADGFDAAIAGGFDLAPGVVARELARVHMVAVASPGFLAGRKAPRDPSELAHWPGVGMRSVQHGRLRNRMLRHRAGREVAVEYEPRAVFNDPHAITQAALLGVGFALLAMPHALPHLESGALQRVLPQWYWDDGPISLYFSGQRLLPRKTRVFVDYIVAEFRERGIAQRLKAA